MIFKKIKSFVIKNKVILIVLLLSAFLRFSGIKNSYQPNHSDEGMSYSQGIYMLLEKSLDAHGYSLAYAYPNVVPIINAFAFKSFFLPFKWLSYYFQNLGEIVDGYIKLPLDQQEFNRIYKMEILGYREINVLRWGRMVSAFIGTAVVFLSYLFSKKLFNKKVAYITALLVAVNYRQVLNSHINLPDIYNSFFLLTSALLSYRLIDKPTLKNYFIAGLFAGISFSVKFHIYAFVSLFTAHVFSIKGITFRSFLTSVFNKKIILSFFVSLAIILLINPYHFINYQETMNLLSYVAKKYSSGRMLLDTFSYSYLYYFGLTPPVTLITIVGFFWALVKDNKKTLYLLSIIISFLFVVTFYTRGGFYTRNFVTIIPFFLIFAAYSLSKVLEINKKIFSYLVFIFVMGIVLRENFTNSFIVANEYRKPWNYVTLSSWITENIPDGSKISAHSSVPLPIKDVTRLPYDFDLSFSIEEFRNDGADYAVTNLDWATNDFYWWMTQEGKTFFQFWKKPINDLEQTYPALSLRELSDFTVFSVIKKWQAPDSNFIVVKIPYYKAISSEFIKNYNFQEPITGQWHSEVIEVTDWNGFLLKYKMLSEQNKNCFVYISFYEHKEDVFDIKKRLAVRVSARNSEKNVLEVGELKGKIPDGANFAVINFDSYKDPDQSFLENIDIFNSDILMNLNDVKVYSIDIDDNVIFLNSHGNM